MSELTENLKNRMQRMDSKVSVAGFALGASGGALGTVFNSPTLALLPVSAFAFYAMAREAVFSFQNPSPLAERSSDNPKSAILGYFSGLAGGALLAFSLASENTNDNSEISQIELPVSRHEQVLNDVPVYPVLKGHTLKFG